jgi:hypothetical protein
MLSHAPTLTPRSIADGLTSAATGWAADPVRPSITPAVLAHWDMLLDEWGAADDLPLFVRKFNDNRGHELKHRSGRTIVPTDNSPAHWSVMSAFAGERPTLDDVRGLLQRDRIPVAMAFRRTEKDGARYRCTRSELPNPNQLGWKVAHIDDVGLGYTGDICDVAVPTLAAHHKRFLTPSNIFLVPKEYAGVAETPEFIQAFRNARDHGANQT